MKSSHLAGLHINDIAERVATSSTGPIDAFSPQKSH